MKRLNLAILDDYQHVALKMADWSKIAERCQIDVIDKPLKDLGDATRTLAPYARERQRLATYWLLFHVCS